MEKWVPFEERPEWSDVKGVKEAGEKAPIGKMKYSDICKIQFSH